MENTEKVINCDDVVLLNTGTVRLLNVTFGCEKSLPPKPPEKCLTKIYVKPASNSASLVSTPHEPLEIQDVWIALALSPAHDELVHVELDPW